MTLSIGLSYNNLFKNNVPIYKIHGESSLQNGGEGGT